MAKKTEVRREQIVTLASETGLTSVEALAAQFGVTPSTIRRDLAQLSAEGRLARTYGGAIAPQAHVESSLREREREGYAAKSAIATWAAEQIEPGETILLDAGSTTSLVARRLPEIADLTVATASIPVITALQGREDLELISLGGRLRALSQAFVGPLTEMALERLTFDRVFLGTDGVATDGSICEAELDQTRLKELLAGRAREVYVLAHSAKLGQAPFNSWARLAGPWTLVTDSGADPAFLADFTAGGRRAVTADLPA
ncbi:DeoR/GlpR family DNA-binding transcription regulator [Pseudactinotalea sp.]|uniref:DeoR/GlpR family DNA-binding transcription regulator n=1 Tax=Pseudactinotalea sp. TaxID=1926260 RepID=UPI003B3B4DAB